MKPEIIILLLYLGAILLTLEVRYNPRLGYTRNKEILLWYTIKYKRKYLILFKL